MSDERQVQEQDWEDNPRLNAWLAEQEAAFPAWAAETGEEWDFTPASLDRLEGVMWRWFSTWEEVNAAQESPRVSVAAWYLGEVQNRHYGTVWIRSPQPPPEDLIAHDGTPSVLMPDPRSEYEKAEAEARGELFDENDLPGSNPYGELRGLFVRGPENRLRDVLDRYTRPAPIRTNPRASRSAASPTSSEAPKRPPTNGRGPSQ